MTDWVDTVPAAPAPLEPGASGSRPGVVWFCLRGSLRARRAGYVALALIVGLIGGLSMASIAAARRTQSSYPTYLASTNPSNLNVSVYTADGGTLPKAASRRLTTAIEGLPGVESVRTEESLNLFPLRSNGAPIIKNSSLALAVGSPDGLGSDQDRLAAIDGRTADPKKPGEIELTQGAVDLLGMHLGEHVQFGMYSANSLQQPGFGTPRVRPQVVVHATVVGIVDLNTQVIEDDVDSAYGFVFVTPALLQEAVAAGAASGEPVLYGIQVRGGATAVPALERAIVQKIPPQASYAMHVTTHTESQVELALRPESLALGGFGVIAAIVCLLLGALAITRQIRDGREDRQVLRSLGGGPFVSATEGLAGIILAVALGVVLAIAVAIGLSPLAPLGPVRAVYPSRGVSFDWAVLGIGAAALLGILGSAAALAAWRGAPHRSRARGEQPMAVSRLISRAEAAGLPATAVIGTRFALESGRGRTAVSVRSALLGSVVAIATVVTTLTFSSSLTHLVATPPLYGWNWSYELNPSNDIPVSVFTALKHDPDVAAATGMEYVVVSLDGQQVPVIITVPDSLSATGNGGVDPAVSPPILSGTGLLGPHDIVMGSSTLAALHKKIGQSVTLVYGNPSDRALYVPPTKLRIVGTTTLPAVGYSTFVQDHTSMGYGAMFAFAALPPHFRKAVTSPDPNLNGPRSHSCGSAPG